MTARPVVLIANDQEWSARSLESILAPNGFRVLRAYTGRQALEQAREHRPDLIILDAQMPDMHGFDICRELRGDPRISPATPIILTTAGPSGRAQRLEAYRAGAWEFLGQPLDGEALVLKLQAFVRSKVEVDRLREESLLDQQTGLYSMRGLTRRAREIGAEAARRHEALACVVFGPESPAEPSADPAAAEEAARIAERIGEILRRASRRSDAVGRLGPAEFGVVAAGTAAAGAVRLADRIGAAVEASPIPLGGQEHWIRLRAGYCAVPNFAESAVDALELMLRATTALHDLQRQGDSERVRPFESPVVDLPN